MTNQRYTVTICGGGLGGLTLGLALGKYGIPFRIFERAPGLSEVGAGITLWSNAIAVLEHLGVAEAVRAVSEPSRGGVIGLANGEILVEASADDLEIGDRPLELWAAHRIELQRALYEQLPPDAVHFGMPLRRFHRTSKGVVAEFEHHPDVESSLLVGADGIGSIVRDAIRGASRPRYAGYVCWRGVCPIPRDWCGVPGEFWGIGDRFGVVRLPGNRLYWFAVVTAAEGSSLYHGGSRGRLGFKPLLLERFGHYAFSVPEILQKTYPDAIVFRDIIDRPPERGWSSGSVVLLGDAAHSTTPNMGQGAGMAMESALILARCLAETPNTRHALMHYERTRWARTRMITETSSTIGKMAHWQNPLARALRNKLFRSTPPAVRRKQLLTVGGYDAGTAPLAG